MRDELGPSAPRIFNQSEEMLELNVELKDVEKLSINGMRFFFVHGLGKCQIAFITE